MNYVELVTGFSIYYEQLKKCVCDFRLNNISIDL